jgi:hypothetical protein
MSVMLDKLAVRAGRNLFLPIAFRFLLRLEQVTWAEFCEDPALATYTLRASQRLFKADGLVNWFDTWLEAQPAGAAVERDELGFVKGAPAPPHRLPDPKTFASSSAIQRSIELANRLSKETGDAAAVFGYLTGFHTLLARLFSPSEARRLVQAVAEGKPRGSEKDAIEAAVGLSLVLARGYCEAGCGALLLAEEEAPGDLRWVSALAPLLNLADYYGVPVLLLCRDPLEELAREAARAAGVRYVAAPGAENGLQIVPSRVLQASVDDAVLWAREVAAAGDPRIFLTEWEIPTTAAPEAVLALQKALVP